MTALAREIRSEVQTKEVRLVGSARGVTYRQARSLFPEHLGHLVVNGSDEDKQELNRNLARVDELALDDQDRARDALVYLVLDMQGEKYLEELLRVYDVRFGTSVSRNRVRRFFRRKVEAG